MAILGNVVLVLVLGFVALVVAMQVLVQVRARALAGKPLPPLPGVVGERVTRSKRALVYFFSPACGACRAITPRVRALGQKNPSVFAIDVSQSVELARALRIMATPSTVEIAEGKIVALHIGPIPADVMARFS
jgi:thiol-disulfide isomerase/thioredoxin